MAFRPFSTPHCHPCSLDSASTPEAFADRELELGTGTLTVTDHGSMGACRDVYDIAKQKGLTPILGLEGYHRDDNCSILEAHGIKGADIKEYYKYGHLTIGYTDQAAYEAGCRILSSAADRAEKHGSEYKPLFTWANLEELGQYNVTFTSSCLAGMVNRHFQAERADIAIAYYERLRSLVKPGNFYVEVFPHHCDKYWVQGVFIKFKGVDQEVQYRTYKNLKCRIDGEDQAIKAEALAKLFDRKNVPSATLVAQMDNRQWVDREPQEIESIRYQEGFLPNECHPLWPDGDPQRGANRFVMQLARKYGDQILCSDDSHFSHKGGKSIQDVRLMAHGGSWRMYDSYHRMSSDESWEYFRDMGVPQAKFEQWIDNSHEWAAKFKDFTFNSPVSLPLSFYPQDTKAHTLELIRKHGRMNWRDPAMVERLAAEFRLLHDNGTIDLLPYFFMGEEVCDQYRQNGDLSGPGRGSAAGVLITYLLGITHVNPLRYGLSMDRFLTQDRITSGRLPDIDFDFPSRDLLVDPETGWLKKRFGDNFAQISTNMMLRLRSSIKDVHRVLHGKVLPEIEAITNVLPIPPQGIDDADFIFGYDDSSGHPVPGIIETDPTLKAYAAKYPEEWALVQNCLGLTRSKSRHASAYVIADKPISSFVPTQLIGGVRCTQYTAKAVEASGGLKMDFLVINSLRDISQCIRLIQQRAGYEAKVERINGVDVPPIQVVPHKGEVHDIWDLPEDPGVYRDICESDTATVFQFDTPAVRKWLANFIWEKGGQRHYGLGSINDLSAFTALDRPGPLDFFVEEGSTKRNMLEEFAARARGEKPIGANKLLDEMFPETYGVVVFQESLQRAFQVIGKTTGPQANQFREDIAKKRMAKVMKWKETFMQGAVDTVGAQEAEKLWSSFETFGQYGFNRSHAVCYVTVSYACAWLKHHYPLEWWTSVLNHANRNEIDGKFWIHCGHLIDMPDVRMSGPEFQIHGDRIRAPLWLLDGIGEAAHKELTTCAPYTDIEDFCKKIVANKESKTTVGPDGKKKAGRSSIHKTIMLKLILSGAADALFPPDMGDFEKIETWRSTLEKISGKKAAKMDLSAIRDLLPLQKFQLRKSILPTYSQDLVHEASRLARSYFVKQDGDLGLESKRRDDGGNSYVPVVDGQELRSISDSTELLTGALRVGVIAYVNSTEIKTARADKNRKRCVVKFEVDGERFEFVKWPSRDGEFKGLPPDLDGAVVAMVMTKYAENKPPSIDDIYVVQEPLKMDKNEKEESR